MHLCLSPGLSGRDPDMAHPLETAASFSPTRMRATRNLTLYVVSRDLDPGPQGRSSA